MPAPPAFKPLIALTLGDVAGIGPEVVAKAWINSPLLDLAQPVAIGSPEVLRRALARVGAADRVRVEEVPDPESARPTAGVLPCLEPAGAPDVAPVAPGTIDPRAGRAAHDYLVAATDLALAGRIDAIVTLPLNKESLHAGGIDLPGHTEILARRCGVPDHAMMLWLEGLGVVHVTLHVPLRSIFGLITEESVLGKVRLARDILAPLVEGRPPRVAVAGLNPHAGEHGLFGDEEGTILAPAVARARAEGIDASGPIAADTLFARARAGEFDGVVAMYHDQGHVALKTVGFDRAVNVTAGLPIVRTSVAHGTAYDIAWTGRARPDSLLEAVRVAARLAASRTRKEPPRT